MAPRAGRSADEAPPPAHREGDDPVLALARLLARQAAAEHDRESERTDRDQK